MPTITETLYSTGLETLAKLTQDEESRFFFNFEPFTPTTNVHMIQNGSTSSDLIMQIRLHAPNGVKQIFWCDICDYKTSLLEDIKQHLSTDATSSYSIFCCGDCDYKTPQKSLLKTHSRIHAMRNCKFSQTRIHRLIKTSHTGEKLSKGNTDPLIKGCSVPMSYFKCTSCDYKTTNNKSLKLHIRRHTRENLLSSSTEYRTPLGSDGLTLHMSNAHSRENNVFMCAVCDYKTNAKKRIREHIVKKHVHQRLFCCAICGHRTNLSSSLKRHIFTHTGEKSVSCNLCNYKTSRVGDLNIHKRTHTGEKQFLCDICGYRAPVKNRLRCHIQTHTSSDDIRRFSCDICGFKAIFKSRLVAHVKRHTGEKDFACPFCKLRTSNRTYLDNHINNSHTREKAYSCEFCKYRTFSKWNLKKHVETHVVIRRFVCTACDYKAINKSHLVQHIKNCHL